MRAFDFIRPAVSQRCLDPVPGVEQVAAEDFGKAGLVASFERGDHFLMFPDGCCPLFRAFMADEADAFQPGLQHGVDIDERTVLRQADDRGVDVLVEFVILQAVGGLVAVDHLVVQRSYLGNLGVACHFAGESPSEFLECP